MSTPKTLARIAGTTLAGAIGFAIGFYAGFFLIMSIWGLEANELAFVFIAGTLGVVGATLATTLTVSSDRRWVSAATTGALGLVLLLVIFALDADFGAMAVGALLMVTAASALVRTGAMDPIGT